MENIIKIPVFASILKRLQYDFEATNIGYEHWRTAQNKGLTDCFRDENRSRSTFGQALHVASEEVNLVNRSKAWQELNDWLSSWSASQAPFVLLGDEGDGKTWAVASWLDWQIQNVDNFPPAIFLSSSQPRSNEPASLLSEAIARHTGPQEQAYWENRLMRWIQRPIGESPVIILVLDGINERRTPQWWRQLIEGIMTSPWRERMAVLITARMGYWSRYFSGLRHLNILSHGLSSYDDEELDIALRLHHLARSAVADSLLPLIRKPRYLDLVVKHRERMAKSGDITVARLIYEDWRDRWSRKTNLSIDDQSFQNLIKGLAQKARQYSNNISEKDIAEQLPFIHDKQVVFDDLVSGGILHDKTGSYQVDESRLILGFGLLLADQVEHVQSDLDHPVGLNEIIASWLEPHPEMGIKAKILETAALHVLSLQDNFSESCQVALLHAWLTCKNPQEDADENFIAYLLIQPVAYLKLAEMLWSDDHDNPWAQNLLMRALLRWRDSPALQSILPDIFARWLGFVHAAGYSRMRHGKKEEDIKNIKKKIAERLGQNLTYGPQEFAGFPLSVIQDDGLLRLGRVALAVISHLPRKPYLRAIATGCLAEAIMDFPDKYDLFGWVLRSSPETLWPEIKHIAESLLNYDHIVTKQTAYRLLSLEGGQCAVKMQKQLSEDLFPPHPFREIHRKDPCNSFFAWTRAECEYCLQRKDLAPSVIARKIQLYCRDPKFPVPSNFDNILAPITEQIPLAKIWSGRDQTAENHLLEEIESALCAYSPDLIARIYRAIANTVNDRKEIALRQLVLHIIQHELILDDETKKNLQTVWRRLLDQSKAKQKDEELAEVFLFHAILQGIDAEQQLEYLLNRPSTAADLLAFEKNFKPLNDWQFVSKKMIYPEPESIRRVLWFLSAHPQIIPESVLSIVGSLISHKDRLVRGLVLQILYKQRNAKNTCDFVQGKWAWEEEQHSLENYWGSLLLAKHGYDLPYSELRCRVHPTYLGFAVAQRDNNHDEVNQYAEDIHKIWATLVDATPDIPNDFPAAKVDCDLAVRDVPYERIGLSGTHFSNTVKFISRDAFWGGMSGGSDRESLANALKPVSNEQQDALMEILQGTIKQQTQAGNNWFSSSFSSQGLELVAQQRPDLVDIWLAGIMDGSLAAKQRLMKGRSFYEALCRVLFPIDPPKGLHLYQHLTVAHAGINFVVSGTGIPVLCYSLFNAPDVPAVKNAWDQYLQQCKTDKDLSDLVIVALAGNGINWLESTVEQDLRSTPIFYQARAMIIRGLMASKNSEDWLAAQTGYPLVSR